uniref:ORF4 n=1 Tax=Tobacco necrosis virus (strain D) TaxID=12056 RepID=A0A1Z2THS9_TNVD|nr:p7b [Tobacco necrosis virus D]QYA72315.1 ORF4 [Tobacco necrosis virus D]
MKYIIVQQNDPFPLLGVWIIVIIIIAVIGLLNQSPPERPYQTFKEDNSKIQYITIGGATTTKVSTN